MAAHPARDAGGRFQLPSRRLPAHRRHIADAIGMPQAEKDQLNREIEGSYRDGKDAVSGAEKVSS